MRKSNRQEVLYRVADDSIILYCDSTKTIRIDNSSAIFWAGRRDLVFLKYEYIGDL